MSRTLRLTDAEARTLSLGAKESERTFFDDDVSGFGLRVRAGGARSWVFQYRAHGVRRRVRIGTPGVLKATQAREAARKLKAKVELGADPAAERRETLAEAKRRKAFGSVVREDYLPARKDGIGCKQLRDRSYKEVERHLLQHAKPLHVKSIGEIQRSDVAAILTKITKAAGGPTANRVQSSLSGFFSWAIRQGAQLPQGNVATNVNLNEEKPRKRILKDSELRAVWLACDPATDYGAIVRLLILTAQRRDEIGRLRVDELKGTSLLLPEHRTKNGSEHLVPLSPAALAILDRKPKADHFFGRNGTGFSGWSKEKAALDARVTKALGKAPAPWVLHDLRRTAATGMSALGVKPHVVEMVLNHRSGFLTGVAGVYNLHSYEAEMREALTLWADRVDVLVGGGR